MPGNAVIRTGESPQLRTLCDATCQVSADPGASLIPALGRWGVFDKHGKPVPEALTLRQWRVGKVERTFDEFHTLTDDTQVADVIEEPCYFLGPLIPHFGHFLVETMSRLWAYGAVAESVGRLVYCGPRRESWGGSDPTRLLEKHRYIGEIFATFGIRPDRLMPIRRTTTFEKLLVPEPSFSLGRHAFPQFFEMYDDVRRQMLNGSGDVANDTPVYLSKAEWKKGVTGIANDHELEDAFSALGVEIVHLEKLTLQDQVRLVNSRSTMIGVRHSGFFALLLSDGKKKTRYICPQPVITPDFVVIERYRQNDCVFFFTPTEKIDDPAYQHCFKISEPRWLAQEILESL
jgi:Glycosyltransferase 61